MTESETPSLLSLGIPTYPDREILNALSPEREFWVSGDCTLRIESQNPERTIASGIVEFDPLRYLGFAGDPKAMINFFDFLRMGELFSTRSVLMQSLQRPIFEKPQVNERGILTIPTHLVSLNDIPVKVPEALTLGRWYFPGSAVYGPDLDAIAQSASIDPDSTDPDSIDHDVQIEKTIVGPSGAMYDEIPKEANPNEFTSQSLAFSVPVDDIYFLNDADEIDLGEISHLTRENRDRLGALLGQRLVSKDELQKLINESKSLHYVGQTREISVPEGVMLQINMGHHSRRGEHHISPLIDPKYHGRVRVEAHSSAGQIFDRVQFSAFRKTKKTKI
ncbi:MAG: hypothetical protein WCO78_03460 [Candidatus Roizmanbacteria bacterium]